MFQYPNIFLELGKSLLPLPLFPRRKIRRFLRKIPSFVPTAPSVSLFAGSCATGSWKRDGKVLDELWILTTCWKCWILWELQGKGSEFQLVIPNQSMYGLGIFPGSTPLAAAVHCKEIPFPSPKSRIPSQNYPVDNSWGQAMGIPCRNHFPSLCFTSLTWKTGFNPWKVFSKGFGVIRFEFLVAVRKSREPEFQPGIIPAQSMDNVGNALQVKSPPCHFPLFPRNHCWAWRWWENIPHPSVTTHGSWGFLGMSYQHSQGGWPRLQFQLYPGRRVGSWKRALGMGGIIFLRKLSLAGVLWFFSPWNRAELPFGCGNLFHELPSLLRESLGMVRASKQSKGFVCFSFPRKRAAGM